MINLDFETRYWNKGLNWIAGVDEAGRGPLAGPVVAAAVVFEPGVRIDEINDSKKLTEKKREELFEIIGRKAFRIGVGTADHRTIDQINILNATFRSMHQAIANLRIEPNHILVDGPYFAGANIPSATIVKGDSICFSIAAASIIAKVVRDRLMKQYDEKYPQYGFARHKGYGTREHYKAIQKYGLCEIHRRSFRISINSVWNNDKSA